MIRLLLALAAASSAQDGAARGDALYFQGQTAKAIEAYAQTVKKSSASASAWLNGAVVLEESGRLKEAERWYGKAAALTPDAEVLGALGWAQWRQRKFSEARATFERAIKRRPDAAWNLLGAGRASLDAGDAKAAVVYLAQAEKAAPLLYAAPFYEGKAYEELGEDMSAIEAYKKAVIGDSYFVEGRQALGRLYLRYHDYNNAWKQFSRVLDAEPHNKRLIQLVDHIEANLTRKTSQLRPSGLHKPIPYLVDSPVPGSAVPMIRAGIGTDGGGKPRARPSVAFRVSTAFEVLDASTKKRLAAGDADDAWSARSRKVKSRWQLAVFDPDGKLVSVKAKAVLIRPREPAKAVTILDEVPGAGVNPVTAGRALRGQLEIGLYKGGIKLVNVVDLENYTHGVVSSEMPINSPVEALKAQAVMARTHALYIVKQTRRHRKEGYDVCDGEHCQVYGGVRSESERSREIVEATKGRVVTYKNRMAQVIYSSNCGGFTQSGGEVTGWGDVAYWKGIADEAQAQPRPRSPWELRQFLSGWPPAYCKPSTDVHPSHFRWTRVIDARELAEKLDKKFKIGKLLAIKPLRRSSSGNVNAVQLVGSRKKVKLDSEMQIRSFMGVGSLRSTLFVMDTEYDANGKPRAFFFRGGGWGHGVGLCQSGAMGRAEAGQTYEQIIKAYFKGVELSQLRY